MADAAFLLDAKREETAVVPLDAWLRRRRGIPVWQRDAAINVCEQSVGQWLNDVTAQKERRDSPEEDQLEGLIAHLRGIQPGHRVVLAADAYAGAPNLRRTEILSLLRTDLSMAVEPYGAGSLKTRTLQASRTPAGPDTGAPTIKESDGVQSRPPATIPVRAQTSDVVAGGRVYRFGGNGQFDVTSASEAVGMSRQAVAASLSKESTRDNTRQAILATELALYDFLSATDESTPLPEVYGERESDAAMGDHSDRPNYSRAVVLGGGKEVLLNRTDLFTRKIIAGALAGVLSTGMAFGAYFSAEAYRGAAIHNAQEALAKQRQVPVGAVSGLDSVKKTHADSGFVRVWDSIFHHKAVVAIQRVPTSGGAGPVSKSPAFFGAGNVDPSTPLVADWRITPHGTMNTSGYWVTASSSNMWTYHKDGTTAVDWVIERKDVEKHAPRAMDKRMSNWLQVESDISPLDARVIDGYTDGFDLPVRAGTRVFATTLNNEPLSFAYATDGTAEALVPKGQLESGRLRYWLVPGESLTQSDPRGLEVSGNMAYSLHRLQQLWSKIIPHYNPSDPEQLMHFIKDDWKYALQPLPANMAAATDLTEFATLASIRRLANCNLASTLMGMTMPELQARFGYINGSMGTPNALTNHELHQWSRSTRTGIDYDATPTEFANPAERAYFEDAQLAPEHGEEDSGREALEILALLGGGIVLAGLVEPGQAMARRLRRRGTVLLLSRNSQELSDVLIAQTVYGNPDKPLDVASVRKAHIIAGSEAVRIAVQQPEAYARLRTAADQPSSPGSGRKLRRAARDVTRYRSQG